METFLILSTCILPCAVYLSIGTFAVLKQSALLVGVIGSHLYGLLEALIYQPTAEVNVLFVTFGLLILLVITVVVLFKVYIKRLFESTKKFREFRKGR